MNTLTKKIKKDEDLWCYEEYDDIENLNNCIRSLNFYKDKFFGEYHQSKKDDTTFIQTPDQIKN